jgi:hypothetical protein
LAFGLLAQALCKLIPWISVLTQVVECSMAEAERDKLRDEMRLVKGQQQDDLYDPWPA